MSASLFFMRHRLWWASTSALSASVAWVKKMGLQALKVLAAWRRFESFAWCASTVMAYGIGKLPAAIPLSAHKQDMTQAGCLLIDTGDMAAVVQTHT